MAGTEGEERPPDSAKTNMNTTTERERDDAEDNNILIAPSPAGSTCLKTDF
ncbi:hypothetical protein A2U01_0045612 [Trifolium medium]|uniref:Uncharacterized protein n=1 Tax=Trifolium medium TaxID=97028 RepID=A0A392QKF9_9FABA|nr:hypothetical protein [Trifolium medium]